jgi:hypothetical protein
MGGTCTYPPSKPEPGVLTSSGGPERSSSSPARHAHARARGMKGLPSAAFPGLRDSRLA